MLESKFSNIAVHLLCSYNLQIRNFEEQVYLQEKYNFKKEISFSRNSYPQNFLYFDC